MSLDAPKSFVCSNPAIARTFFLSFFSLHMLKKQSIVDMYVVYFVISKHDGEKRPSIKDKS